MDTTRFSAADPGLIRVWMADDDLFLVSRLDRTQYPWEPAGDPGDPFSSISDGGVAAVAWVSGSFVYERVYFVAANGNVYEYAIDDGVPSGWTRISPPGSALTGQLDAMTVTDGAIRYLMVAFSDEDGNLWVLRRDVTNSGPWEWVPHEAPPGGQINPAGPIETAVLDYNNSWYIFVTTTDGRVFVRTWVNGQWDWIDVGAPVGETVCGSMDAITGLLRPNVPRVLVYCTTDVMYDNGFYMAYSQDGVDFQWVRLDEPPVEGGFRAGAFIVAAAKVTIGQDREEFHGYAIGENNRLYISRLNEVGQVPLEDLGKPDEIVVSHGGMAAADNRVFHYSSYWTTAGYLLEHDRTTTGPEEWILHGTETAVNQVTDTTDPHTEVMLAEFQGKMIAPSIVRKDPYYVETSWSWDDGLSWERPVRLPNPYRYDFTTDPIADFDSHGTAFVGALGWSLEPGESCGTGSAVFIAERAGVYFLETSDGYHFSNPVLVVETTDDGNYDRFIDHGWMAIDRSSDRKHFVWLSVEIDKVSGKLCQDVMYTYLNADGTTGNVSSLSQGGDRSCPYYSASGASPPTLVVGGDGNPYAVWLGPSQNPEVNQSAQLFICRIIPEEGACAYPPVYLPQETGAYRDGAQILVGSEGKIIAFQAWSLAASKTTPGLLFLAFHGKNTNNPDRMKDVFFSVSTGYGQAGSWSPAVMLNDEGQYDDTDQFFPAVTVTDDDTVFVGWYDRRTDHNNKHNYYIWPYFIPIFNRGTNLGPNLIMRHDYQTGPTDPALFPIHCGKGTYFLGDYHESRGAGLHTHLIYSLVKEGSPKASAFLWETFLSPRDYWYER